MSSNRDRVEHLDTHFSLLELIFSEIPLYMALALIHCSCKVPELTEDNVFESGGKIGSVCQMCPSPLLGRFGSVVVILKPEKDFKIFEMLTHPESLVGALSKETHTNL